MSEITINDLPLDCLRLIAKVSLDGYRGMLLIRRFALSTLSSTNNAYYRSHFTKRVERTEWQYCPCCSDLENFVEYRLNGILHREDGPAVIYEYGSAWYLHGVEIRNTFSECNTLTYNN
jgi:hypothetical protein